MSATALVWADFAKKNTVFCLNLNTIATVTWHCR